MSNTKNGRVNRFIFNSDYLTLAKAASASTIVTMPSFQIAAGKHYGEITKDLTLSVPKGAIARPLVTFQGTSMTKSQTQAFLGGFEIDETWDLGIRMLIYQTRKDANTIQIQEWIERLWYDEAITVPSIAFTLTEKFFYPPNA